MHKNKKSLSSFFTRLSLTEKLDTASEVGQAFWINLTTYETHILNLKIKICLKILNTSNTQFSLSKF